MSPGVHAEQPLPETKVDFHFLPRSELSKNEQKAIRSVAATRYSFVRALTLQMWVPEEEVELVSPSHRRGYRARTVALFLIQVYHLREMSVECSSRNILIMDRERLELAESGWEGQEGGIGYQRDLTSQKRLFFFIKFVYLPTLLTLPYPFAHAVPPLPLPPSESRQTLVQRQDAR